MKNIEYEKYVTFYQGFGPVLKEGLARDWTNREKIADLLLFESPNTEAGQVHDAGRVRREMPAEQKEIYYLIGESRELLRHSPYLEAFRAKGYDVLLLTDPIDEFAIPGLASTRGRSCKPPTAANLRTRMRRSRTSRSRTCWRSSKASWTK